MPSESDKFEMFELTLRSPPETIAAASRTICHAFSDDPLIRWVRPAARPWGDLCPTSMAWQSRRILQNLVDGRVFAIRHSASDSRQGQEQVLPAVAFLVEPFTFKFWLSRVARRLYLWFLDTFAPIRNGVDEQRLAKMMEMHDAMLEAACKKYQRPINYIEVVAVDPKQQGAGLGSRILKHVLAHCDQNVPVVLESTRDTNVPFYERFGFEVIDQGTLAAGTELTGDLDQVSLWLMAKK